MSVENWTHFLETEEQHKQSKLLRHALSRVIKKPIERRITSSAHSDRIYAVDCCWLAKDSLPFENLASEASNADATTAKLLTNQCDAVEKRKSDENSLYNDTASAASLLTYKNTNTNTTTLTTTTTVRSSTNLTNLQSHILFGLSNGSVCVMNTSAFTKVYLFENSSDRKRYTSSTEAGKPTPVTLDVVVLPASAISTNAKTINKTYCAMCMARNKMVQICIFDINAFTELKILRDVSASTITYYPIIKVSSTNDNNNNSSSNSNCANSLSLPAMVAASSTANAAIYGVPVVRFSPTGEHIVVVLPCIHALGISHQMLIMEKKIINEITSSLSSSSSSVYNVANTWRSISLASSSQSPVMWHNAIIIYCEWWNTSLVLLIFSDGLIALLEPFTNVIHAKTNITDKKETSSCCTECVTSAVYTRCSGNGKWCARHPTALNKSVHGILAVTYSFNVVATFTMDVCSSESANQLHHQNERQNFNSSVHIELTPTLQTYCAEDNSVRQMRLLNVFDWVLCILLESGAMLFFSAFTMEELMHCAIERTGISRTARNDMLWLEAVKARHKNATNIAQLASPRLHQLCLLHNPVSVCVIDGNSASIFRSESS